MQTNSKKVYKINFLNKLKLGISRIFKTDINLEKYYAYKIIMILIICILSYNNNIMYIAALGIILFFATDLYFIENFKTYNKKIVYELNSIIEMMLRLLEAKVPYKYALELSSEVIMDNEFKKIYKDLIYKFEMNRYNNSIILEICKSKYNNSYLNNYIKLINISVHESDFVDMLENMLEIIDQDKIIYITKKYQINHIKKYFTLFLLLIINMIILIYPIITEICNNFNTIF